VWLLLYGRTWSAIVSFVIFASICGVSLFASFELSDQGGSGPQFAQLYMWIAIIALAMIVLTYSVFRRRQKKIQSRNKNLVNSDK
jgi:Kef-type K+ transport system membrane component KefB